MILKKSSSFTLTLFLLISYTFSTYPQEAVQLMQIESSQIEQQKAKVMQELKRNAYIKIGLITAVGATMSYGCYKLFFDSAGVATPIDVSPAMKEIQNKVEKLKNTIESFSKLQNDSPNLQILKKLCDLSEDLKEEQHLNKKLIEVCLAQKEVCDSYGYYPLPTKNWWPWLKSWGKYFGAQYVFIGISSIVAGTISPFTKYLRLIDKGVDSLFDKVFHNADLNWYLSTHTNLLDLYAQIEQHADSLVKSTHNTQDFMYHRDELVNSWNLFILQLESTLGFMTYKSDLFSKESAINAQRGRNLVNRLMMHINENVLSLQTIILASTISGDAGAQLKSKLASINTVMQESLHSFAAYEVLTLS